MEQTPLTCPHCGYQGGAAAQHFSGFHILNDAQVYWDIRIKDHTIIGTGCYRVYDDCLTNDRLECGNCLKEFQIPEGFQLDWR